METWGESLNWYLIIVLFLIVANMNHKKTTVYCLPKMINLINKEKIWFLKTLRLRFRNHAWFKKKKNEETSNQIMLYTHYTLKKLNLKIKILAAEHVTQFCENNNFRLSVILFCMSVKDYRVTYIMREVT